jgi:hypothetical protein
MNPNRILLWITISLLVLVAGCLGTSPLSPAAGWRHSKSDDPAKLDQAIVADYQAYVQKLQAKSKGLVGGVFVFESGNGQRAITIGESFRGMIGTEWTHVLIYDKSRRRIKAMKYRSSRSVS